MIVAAALTGRWVAAAGSRLPMTAGCLLAAGGVLATDLVLGPDVSYAPLALSLLAVGVGFGVALVPVTATALGAVPAARSGMAASVSNTSRQLGAVVGVAVLGAVVNAKLTGSLEHRLNAIGIPAKFQSIVLQAVTHGGVPQSAGQAQAPSGSSSIVAKVIDAAFGAFGDGLHVCLAIAAALLLMATIVAFVLVRPAPSDSDQGAAPVEGEEPVSDPKPNAPSEPWCTRPSPTRCAHSRAARGGWNGAISPSSSCAGSRTTVIDPRCSMTTSRACAISRIPRSRSNP